MVVQVTDRFGNPIAGVSVFFRVSVGFGSLSNPLDVTDAGGFAETVYTSEAGSSGGVAVSATAPGVGTVLFEGSITAIGTPPDTTGGGGGGTGCRSSARSRRDPARPELPVHAGARRR